MGAYPDCADTEVFRSRETPSDKLRANGKNLANMDSRWPSLPVIDNALH